jgi:hypothetical protein
MKEKTIKIRKPNGTTVTLVRKKKKVKNKPVPKKLYNPKKLA